METAVLQGVYFPTLRWPLGERAIRRALGNAVAEHVVEQLLASLLSSVGIAVPNPCRWRSGVAQDAQGLQGFEHADLPDPRRLNASAEKRG